MKLSSLVCFEAVIPELKARDRDGAIAELVEALSKTGRLKNSDCKQVIKAVIKRENEASTGIGKGVAVPHTKHPAVKEVMAAVGRTSTGIDFSSLDKQPVYSILLVLSPPTEPEKHLQAMEVVFKHLQRDNFRRFLRQMHTAEQIRELLFEADENPLL
jgi:mannitol/fructose-specific phosphotransferase system IIA component (Ntr-type)